MRLEITNKELPGAHADEIEAFLLLQPHNTVFQAPVFYQFYRRQPNANPVYLIARDAASSIQGVLLAVIIKEHKGIISSLTSRCVVHGGPVLNADDPDVLGVLLGGLNSFIGNKALFIQFRNFRDWPLPVKLVFEKHGFVLRDRLNAIIQLTNEQEMYSGLSASRRRQIKKATQAGVSYRPAENMAEVSMLYKILEDLYRNKVRKPLPDWSFFEGFFTYLVPRKAGIVLVVEAKEGIIGGIFAPLTRYKTISELYVCGLDKTFPQYHPSIMATWAAMDYGLRHGYTQFDFMGLGKPNVPYGVRDFKLRFGGDPVNYGRFARRNNKVRYAIAELGYNILRIFRKI